MEQVLAC